MFTCISQKPQLYIGFGEAGATLGEAGTNTLTKFEETLKIEILNSKIEI